MQSLNDAVSGAVGNIVGGIGAGYQNYNTALDERHKALATEALKAATAHDWETAQNLANQARSLFNQRHGTNIQPFVLPGSEPTTTAAQTLTGAMDAEPAPKDARLDSPFSPAADQKGPKLGMSPVMGTPAETLPQALSYSPPNLASVATTPLGAGPATTTLTTNPDPVDYSNLTKAQKRAIELFVGAPTPKVQVFQPGASYGTLDEDTGDMTITGTVPDPRGELANKTKIAGLEQQLTIAQMLNGTRRYLGDQTNTTRKAIADQTNATAQDKLDAYVDRTSAMYPVDANGNPIARPGQSQAAANLAYRNQQDKFRAMEAERARVLKSGGGKNAFGKVMPGTEEQAAAAALAEGERFDKTHSTAPAPVGGAKQGAVKPVAPGFRYVTYGEANPDTPGTFGPLGRPASARTATGNTPQTNALKADILKHYAGAQITDEYRTYANQKAKHDQAVRDHGADANRWVADPETGSHTFGTALDVVVGAGMKAQFKADMRARGLRAYDEGTHVHVDDRTDLPDGPSEPQAPVSGNNKGVNPPAKPADKATAAIEAAAKAIAARKGHK